MLFALTDPLILAKLCIKRTLLQPFHLEGEARTKLLQTRACLVALLAVYVPVVAHKYEIALVVEGNHLTTLKLGLLFEADNKHSHNNIKKHNTSYNT